VVATVITSPDCSGFQEVSTMLAVALQGAAGFCEFPEC
jgi:hypothetical protein